MQYVCQMVGGEHVAAILTDDDRVVDRSGPQRNKFEAMTLRDRARNQGISAFADLDMEVALGLRVPAGAAKVQPATAAPTVSNAAQATAVTVEVPDKNEAPLAPPELPSLDDMTVDELIAFADDRDIQIKRSARKAEIKSAIKAALRKR